MWREVRSWTLAWVPGARWTCELGGKVCLHMQHVRDTV
jgi:hypothetical protein